MTPTPGSAEREKAAHKTANQLSQEKILIFMA